MADTTEGRPYVFADSRGRRVWGGVPEGKEGYHMADTLVTLAVYGATAPGLAGRLHLTYVISGDDATSMAGWLLKIREGKANPPSLTEILRIIAG